MITRRTVVGAIGVGALGAAGIVARPGTAVALTGGDAEGKVRAAVDDVLALVRAPGEAAAKAPGLQKVMERHTAMDRIARFCAGRAWRQMSDSQQAAYVKAFKGYVSRIYARQFNEYSGEQVNVSGSRDLGKKGVLVNSAVTQANGTPIVVEWLVSDRGGNGPEIVDIVIEGVSLLTTQREEIGALYDSNGGDADRLIQALNDA